jgi:hypothetical protein
LTVERTQAFGVFDPVSDFDTMVDAAGEEVELLLSGH